MLSECGAANRNSYGEPCDLPMLNMSSLSNRSPRMDQPEQAAVRSVMNSHVSGLEFVDVFGLKVEVCGSKGDLSFGIKKNYLIELIISCCLYTV